jgi:hypothetical protein
LKLSINKERNKGKNSIKVTKSGSPPQKTLYLKAEDGILLENDFVLHQSVFVD